MLKESEDTDAKEGVGGTTRPPTSEGQEDRPRFGTKEDVRETEPGGDVESEPEDTPRFGTKEDVRETEAAGGAESEPVDRPRDGS